MNQERILQVLRAPHVSEKATIVADQNNTFVFKVAKDASEYLSPFERRIEEAVMDFGSLPPTLELGQM
jgi:ribosomal protein L23